MSDCVVGEDARVSRVQWLEAINVVTQEAARRRQLSLRVCMFVGA